MSYSYLNEKWGQDDFGFGSGQLTWTMSLDGMRYNQALFPELTTADFENAIRAAFDAWENVANIDFVEIPNPNGTLGDEDVDFDLEFLPISGSTIGLAYNTTRAGANDGDGLDRIVDVSIDFDSTEDWRPYAGYAGLSLYAVAVHEIGHGLGLDHVDDTSEILNPFISTDMLGDGDIEGIQRLYGGKMYGDSGNNLVSGYDGNDALYGGAGNDRLNGGDGADALYGGSGVDRALYESASAGVVADLILTNRNTGDAAGDSYNSIELVFGSGYSDEIRGTQTNNVLAGNAGNDLLYGRSGNDDLVGGDGNDLLDGGTGADDLFGGDGVDRVSYASAGSDLIADLILTNRNTGDAAGDTYSSIELLYGSNFNDELRGTQTNNVVAGYAGNDFLFGRGGNDDLFAGSGADFVDGGNGNDDLFGGTGEDRFVFRPNMGNDIVHDFQNNTDTLLFDDALWSGNLSVQQVISTYGSVSGGNVVFNFGGNNILTINGITNTSFLSDDILIF